MLDGSGAGIDFGSNDYLGLARDPVLVEAAVAAAREFGAGGRAARLLRGGSPLHEQAERVVAEWLGAAAALLFPSGYQANVGLLSALARRGDVIVSDRDNHASLIDGARLSRARVLVHDHLDLDDLERALRVSAGAGRPAQVDALAGAILRHRALATPIVAMLRGAAVTFVVGADTGVGKTVVSALLLRAALRLGPARYWKPVQTGDDDDTATVRELATADDGTMLPNLASHPLPASPHEAAAAAGARIERRALDDAFAVQRRFDGRLLVEFAGGLMVPYDLSPRVLQVDWLTAQSGRVVLVARSGLGTLSHTLLSLEALRSRQITVAALFLVGPPHPSNRATLGALAEVERIFELPQLQALDAPTLDAWLDRHELKDLFA